MTAQILHDEDERGPIWFFTSKDTDLVKALTQSHRAVVHFSSKGHDLFASLHGELTLDNNRADHRSSCGTVSSPPGTKAARTIPSCSSSGSIPEHAQVWLNENSLWAGVKLLLGRDPKQEYKDKVADVRTRPPLTHNCHTGARASPVLTSGARMSAQPPLDHEELIQRIRRDLLDS